MRPNENQVRQYLREYNPSLSLGKRLGRGGTADVYELHGVVPAEVLKVMDTRCSSKTDSDTLLCLTERKRMWKYFSNEITTLKQLSSCQYIMPVLDSYEYVDPRDREKDSDTKTYRSVFLVRMPRYESLESFLKSNKMTEQIAINISIDICKALVECEHHSVLHRDVKPDNIFVYRNGSKAHFVLGDFGFCRTLGQFETKITVCGTPPFMAPEIEHRIKIRHGFNSDIFSLGSSLYFLLSGGKFPKYFFEKGENQIDRVSGISSAFGEIILHSVQLHPSNRYQHANDMLSELLALKPSNNKQLVFNSHFIQAKQAILNGNYEKAIKCAIDGYKKKSPDCLRLYAYCLYHEQPENPAVIDKVKQIYDTLTYEGDIIAQYLRAVIHYEEHEYDSYVYNLIQSANAGYVIAQYTYGRLAYVGYPKLGIKQDKQMAINFIVSSAKQGYLPALRFLRLAYEKDPDVSIPYEISNYPREILEDYENKRVGEIVKFL